MKSSWISGTDASQPWTNTITGRLASSQLPPVQGLPCPVGWKTDTVNAGCSGLWMSVRADVQAPAAPGSPAGMGAPRGGVAQDAAMRTLAITASYQLPRPRDRGV